MGYAFIGVHVTSVILIIVQGKTRVSTEDTRIGILHSLRRDVRLLNQIKDTRDLNKRDILEHLQLSGAREDHFDKPSTEFMMNVFENLLRGDKLAVATGHTTERTQRQLGVADTVRSFSAQGQGREYTIHVPALPDNEKASYAEIRFKEHRHFRAGSSFLINLYEGSNCEQKPLQTFKLSPKRTKISSGNDLYVVDITRRLRSQTKHFRGNVTISIKLDAIKTKYQITNHKFENLNPILVLYSQDKQFMKEFYNKLAELDREQGTNRYKRDITNRESRKKPRKRRKNRWRKNKNNSDICQLYDFKVDFDLIGWGPWIIHPKTFNSKVCFGRCPEPIGNEYTPTNHAMLQTLMRMKRPLSAPEPCCVPTKLRPLSMLYFETEDIVVRHHEDMVAAACGCR